MEPSFAAMAADIRDIALAEAVALRRAGSWGHHSLSALHELRERNDRAVAAAALLEELAHHERLIRGLLKVGALVDFPNYSTNTSNLYPGQKWLIEAIGEEVHLEECRARLEAAGIRHAFPIRRAAIVGVAKDLR